jgi:hypothetical protein
MNDAYVKFMVVVVVSLLTVGLLIAIGVVVGQMVTGL